MSSSYTCKMPLLADTTLHVHNVHVQLHTKLGALQRLLLVCAPRLLYAYSACARKYTRP